MIFFSRIFPSGYYKSYGINGPAYTSLQIILSISPHVFSTCFLQLVDDPFNSQSRSIPDTAHHPWNLCPFLKQKFIRGR